MEEANKRLRTFCQLLPKIELHAHLNGSISNETINKLIERKRDRGDAVCNIQQNMVTIEKGGHRTLKECFDMFYVIYQLTDDVEAVFLAACDVIREFADDGVKYLELRSTPREEKSTGMTRETYVETLLSAIQKCKDDGVDIIVKLIVAVNRRNGPQVALDNAILAVKYANRGEKVVVGFDLSGDPRAGTAQDFIPALRLAKDAGLKLAVHMSEDLETNSESADLLALPPDRIGHGTFLLPQDGGSAKWVKVVREAKIPLELCLTSNVKCQTVGSFDNHHFKLWYDMKHPCVVCTDDKGVFSTTLSEEYRIAAETFDLKAIDLWDLSYKSIDYIFAGEELKKELRLKWECDKQKVLAYM